MRRPSLIVAAIGLLCALTPATSQAAASPVSISPTPYNFGSQPVTGGPTAPHAFTVTNTGTVDFTVSTVTLTGAPNSFVWPGNAWQCMPAGPVAPGGSCTLNLAFDPVAAAQQIVTLQVYTQAGDVGSAQIYGTGTAPGLAVSQQGLGFGSWPVASGPAFTMPFMISNPGNAPVSFSAPVISGVGAADYTLTTTCVGSTTVILAPSANCTVQVTFDPVDAGPRPAAITLTSDAGAPLTVNLVGTGTAPTATPSPTALDFPARLTDAGASAAQTVTITNNGTIPLHVASPTLTGAGAGDFTITAQDCSTAAIAVGASCTLSVAFDPFAAGAKSAQLHLTHDAVGGVTDIALTGTGTAPPVDPTTPTTTTPTPASTTPTSTTPSGTTPTKPTTSTCSVFTFGGCPGKDVFLGTKGADHVYGGSGGDHLEGAAGADILEGDADNDSLVGGPGKDHLLGGAGDDTINARDGKPGDTVLCGVGKDVAKIDKGDVVRGCETVRRS